MGFVKRQFSGARLCVISGRGKVSGHKRKSGGFPAYYKEICFVPKRETVKRSEWPKKEQEDEMPEKTVSLYYQVLRRKDDAPYVELAMLRAQGGRPMRRLYRIQEQGIMKAEASLVAQEAWAMCLSAIRRDSRVGDILTISLPDGKKYTSFYNDVLGLVQLSAQDMASDPDGRGSIREPASRTRKKNLA